MTKPVLELENVSKSYRISHQAGEAYTTLREAFMDFVAKPWRQSRPSSTIEEFWALRNVSFKVEESDVLGIIGRNGAGKSTLLKVLSRITQPTSGKIQISGRVASLLEVGTGFHPELTGRENIFLNGSILGMSRVEIRQKFDQIVAFSEIERFLDTPVKRYSSGMYMRLAFAVAAHLDPEVLIVDEVLAVGDARFQKKCLGRMAEVSSSGRTVLFVSHNIGALQAICNKGVVLDRGALVKSGSIEDCTQFYRKEGIQTAASDLAHLFAGPLRSVVIRSLELNGTPLGSLWWADPSSPIEIKVRGTARQSIKDFVFSLGLFADGVRLFTTHDAVQDLEEGDFEVVFVIPPGVLRPHEYALALGGRQGELRSQGPWFWAEDLATIEVEEHWSDVCFRDDLGLINLPLAGQRSQASLTVEAG